jgi:apolipoprotein N-acyltransferase
MNALRSGLSNALVAAAIVTALAACGKSADEPKPVPPPEQSQGAVGPFEIIVPEDGKALDHSFSVNLAQAEGKTEYFITQKTEMDIVLTSASAAIIGCDPAQVKFDHYWFAKADDQFGFPISVGTKFRAKANQRGLLLVVFRQMNGCKSLGYSISLKKGGTQ